MWLGTEVWRISMTNEEVHEKPSTTRPCKHVARRVLSLKRKCLLGWISWYRDYPRTERVPSQIFFCGRGQTGRRHWDCPGAFRSSRSSTTSMCMIEIVYALSWAARVPAFFLFDVSGRIYITEVTSERCLAHAKNPSASRFV